MEHTEEKWEIHRETLNSPQPEYIYGGPNRTHVCDFRKLNPNLLDEVLEQQQANAHLIAAAPVLLAACEAWQKVESEMFDNHPCPDLALRARYRKEAVRLMEIAIAEAKPAQVEKQDD